MNLGILLHPSCSFRDWTQIILLSDKCPYPSKHFNSPMYSNLIKLLGVFLLIYCIWNCHSSKGIFAMCFIFSKYYIHVDKRNKIVFCFWTFSSLLLIPKVHTEIRSSNQLWSIGVKDKIYLAMCLAQLWLHLTQDSQRMKKRWAHKHTYRKAGSSTDVCSWTRKHAELEHVYCVHGFRMS